MTKLPKKLHFAADHGGFELKEKLKKYVSEKYSGIEIVDHGTDSLQSVDYPDIAKRMCRKILEEYPEGTTEPSGILLCGSGVGVSIQANRYKGIRAVLAESPMVAKLSREHNASNILCMGGRVIDYPKACEILEAWLSGVFQAGRHERRIQLLES